MMGGKKTCEKINEQIGSEFFAMASYYSIASYFDSEGLAGFADYYYKQAEEERSHGLKLIKFLNNAGAQVKIPAIPAPKTYSSALEAVQAALAHEEKVTGQIYAIMDTARSENDKQTEQFLQWFIQEQLEEVSSATDVLSLVKKAGLGKEFLVQQYLKHD